MTLNEYQDFARSTAVYPHQGLPLGLFYVSMGLCGESGEFAEHIKKAIRDDDFLINYHLLQGSRRLSLAKELGDVLWYVANAAKELDFSLEEIANINQAKLSDRRDRNVLKGAGDDR